MVVVLLMNESDKSLAKYINGCIQAQILAAMCNDLLSTAPIRSEIDRREASEQLISGKGGEGGVMPMRTVEERAQRQAPVCFFDTSLEMLDISENTIQAFSEA